MAVGTELLIILGASIFAVALLYSCVGHGGASGYIAVMALAGLAPAVLKPTALVLNILVSAVAMASFLRAGHFSWPLFWPFAVTSIPFSFFGGFLNLPPQYYRPLVGVILILAAGHLLVREAPDEKSIVPSQPLVSLCIGAVLGFLSGLTGVGGGIFLSPLLLLLGWARARETSGVAALFILVNSSAGLLGHLGSLQVVPPFTPLLATTALVGGIIGSFLGSRRLPAVAVVRTLAVVLVIAGGKLIFI